MCTLLHHPPLQHDDHVAVHDVAQTVRNRHRGALLSSEAQGIGDVPLGESVDGAGDLVAQDYGGVLKQGARDADALAPPPDKRFPRSPTFVCSPCLNLSTVGWSLCL